MSRIVVTLDLDHTTIPWIPDAPPEGPFLEEEVFADAIRFFNDPDLRKHLFLGFSTGRGPRALNLLEHFPVDALSINNGKQVFFRPSRGGMGGAVQDALSLEEEERERTLYEGTEDEVSSRGVGCRLRTGRRKQAPRQPE